MVRNQLDTMIGCASISDVVQRRGQRRLIASIWRQLKETHLAPIITYDPRLPLPIDNWMAACKLSLQP